MRAASVKWMMVALMAGLALSACSDDDSDGDANPDVTPEPDPMPDPEPQPDPQPEPMPGVDPTPDPEPGMNDVEACQAVCTEVAACPGIIELCGDLTPQVEAGCQDACVDDDARGQILAAGGLPCEVVEPIAIDGFELEELCGDEPAELSYGVATFGDFAVGTEIAVVSFNDLEINFETIVETDSGDTVARFLNGVEFAVLDRIDNSMTLFELDEEGFAAEGPGVLIGDGSNPQDVARVGENVVVAALGLPNLLIFDNALTEFSEVDLSGVNVNDEDGIPEIAMVFDLGNGQIGAVLQNLVNFAPLANSFLVVVDAETATIVDEVELPGGNPFSAHVQEDGIILLGLLGAFGATDGQVVAFDPSDLSIEEGIFTEADIGGDVLSFAPTEEGFLVVVGTDSFTTNLVHLAGDGANAAETLIEAPGFDLGTATFVAATNQVVVTSAVAEQNGLLFFDAADPAVDTAEGPFTHGELPSRAYINLDR